MELMEFLVGQKGAKMLFLHKSLFISQLEILINVALEALHRSYLNRVSNMGKGENAGRQHFFIFNNILPVQNAFLSHFYKMLLIGTFANFVVQ